jgi:hypothetical protein
MRCSDTKTLEAAVSACEQASLATCHAVALAKDDRGLNWLALSTS